MPDRYRLFFRFSSQPIKAIVCVWFNDDDTLRETGSKTDVYSIFRRMLEQGKVPGDINELLTQAIPPTCASEVKNNDIIEIMGSDARLILNSD